MSSAHATVYFPDGFRLYGKYSNTVDQAYPHLFATDAEVEAAWDEWPHDDRRCTCGGPSENVVFWIPQNDEGWHGLACRVCKRFAGPLDRAEVNDDGVYVIDLLLEADMAQLCEEHGWER